jgi:hypothetical protein
VTDLGIGQPLDHAGGDIAVSRVVKVGGALAEQPQLRGPGLRHRQQLVEDVVVPAANMMMMILTLMITASSRIIIIIIIIVIIIII